MHLIICYESYTMAYRLRDKNKNLDFTLYKAGMNE